MGITILLAQATSIFAGGLCLLKACLLVLPMEIFYLPVSKAWIFIDKDAAT
ncbi:MAG: hypothetical protein AB1611_09335 [bacterium]